MYAFRIPGVLKPGEANASGSPDSKRAQTAAERDAFRVKVLEDRNTALDALVDVIEILKKQLLDRRKASALRDRADDAFDATLHNLDIELREVDIAAELEDAPAAHGHSLISL